MTKIDIEELFQCFAMNNIINNQFVFDYLVSKDICSVKHCTVKAAFG